MQYIWGSITKDCINFGNFIIEDAIKKILNDHGFEKPVFEFSTIGHNDKKIINSINQYDCVIIPGCTTLTLKDYPGLNKLLPLIKVPIFNIGAAFSGKDTSPDIKKLNLFFQPIGTRDPFSDNYLKKNNIKTSFIGCPTLHLGEAKKFVLKNNKKIVFFFGYKEIDIQQRILKYVIDLGYQVQVIIQEKKQVSLVKNLPIEIINYDSKKVIKKIKDARLMITARLHGALPTIALGTPVFFVKTMENQRFSLLKYLGINLNDINDKDLETNLLSSLKDPLVSNSQLIYNKVNVLRNNFIEYIKLIKEING